MLAYRAQQHFLLGLSEHDTTVQVQQSVMMMAFFATSLRLCFGQKRNAKLSSIFELRRSVKEIENYFCQIESTLPTSIVVYLPNAERQHICLRLPLKLRRIFKRLVY